MCHTTAAAGDVSPAEVEDSPMNSSAQNYSGQTAHPNLQGSVQRTFEVTNRGEVHQTPPSVGSSPRSESSAPTEEKTARILRECLLIVVFAFGGWCLSPGEPDFDSQWGVCPGGQRTGALRGRITLRPKLRNDQNLWIPGGRTFPEDDLQGIENSDQDQRANAGGKVRPCSR